MLTYTFPAAAGGALIWRHRTLPLARRRADLLGLRGAAFAWRTINGEECSGYWPAGTAAFHLAAAVADATARFVAASQDAEFEAQYGVELLVETARLWMSLGHFTRADDFRIHGVTGPDEYTAIVDDNVYTNLMAQRNLREAAKACERHPEVAARLGVSGEESRRWRTAAEAVYIPYDEKLGVHPQSEGFTRHGEWDFESTASKDYPLLLNFPYFQLYPKQVVKQADLVLALHCPRRRLHGRGEGAQLRLLRAPDRARLVAVGDHPSNRGCGGRTPPARARLLGRDCLHGSARPARKRRQRAAHRCDGR